MTERRGRRAVVARNVCEELIVTFAWGVSLECHVGVGVPVPMCRCGSQTLH